MKSIPKSYPCGLSIGILQYIGIVPPPPSGVTHSTVRSQAQRINYPSIHALVRYSLVVGKLASSPLCKVSVHGGYQSHDELIHQPGGIIRIWILADQ